MKLKLNYIGIVVRDMDASLSFYSRLGLKFADDEGPHREATTEAGLRVALDDLSLIQEIDPDWTTPVGQGVGIAFECESPRVLDEVYAEAIQAGVTSYKAPFDAFWGQRYATILDPDGNKVDLFAWQETPAA